MSKLNTILRDFRRNWFISLTLIIGMLPLLAGGYCMYILIILLPIILLKYRRIDAACGLVILFSFCYTFFKCYNGHEYTPSSFIFDLIYPFILYQSGVIIVTRFRSQKAIILLITIMASCMALPAIAVNIQDAVESGQLINITRTIQSNTNTRAATGYGMMLALMCGSLGILFLRSNDKVDHIIKCYLLAICLGALFATIHLTNRTGIVLAAISFLLAATLPPSPLANIKKLVFFFSIFIITIVYYLGNIDFIETSLASYEARNQGSGSANTYGGRSDLWLYGLSQLFTQPFGSKEGIVYHGNHTYAHNLWIDAGIEGGILCTVILLAISISYIKYLIKFYRYKFVDSFERNLIVIFSVTIFLQSAVEPVIQGVPQFF